MIRDDDRRPRARNPLQLPGVELEADLQEFESLSCEVGGSGRLAAELAMDIREPFESERALRQVLQQRTEGRHLTKRCVEIEWRAVIMLHAPQMLVELGDSHVARGCHKSDTSVTARLRLRRLRLRRTDAFRRNRRNRFHGDRLRLRTTLGWS